MLFRSVCGEIAKDAPRMVDYLCEECATHFEKTKAGLDNIGISYTVNPDIVRGLDYYTKTVFEFVSDSLGAQSTVCGGGRYSGLVEELGGKPTEGIGFAMGIERLVLTIKNQGVENDTEVCPEVFLGAIGEGAIKIAQKTVYDLRQKGIFAEQDLCGRSVKAQMKFANKLGAKYSAVIGDDEIANNKINLKNMESGEQKEVSLTADSIFEYITEGK